MAGGRIPATSRASFAKRSDVGALCGAGYCPTCPEGDAGGAVVATCAAAAKCGRSHDDLPDIAKPFPDAYADIPEAERAARTKLSSELCVLRYPDQVDFFIRGVILVPILGGDDALGFGAWLSQSQTNFERYVRGEAMTPTVGLLGNRFNHHAGVDLDLKARAHFRDGGSRPELELDPNSDHPFSADQRNGITLARAWEIVHLCLPTWS